MLTLPHQCPYSRATSQHLFGKDIFPSFLTQQFIKPHHPYGKSKRLIFHYVSTLHSNCQLLIVNCQLSIVNCQKYPSRFFCSMLASWSKSMTRVVRSLLVVVIISSTIFSMVSASLSMAPVKGQQPKVRKRIFFI